MSRSGYSGDCEHYELYRATVDRSIRGKRGQKLLRDLADGMDAMPIKRLISDDLMAFDGEVCALGAAGVKRGIPGLNRVDPHNPDAVAKLFDVATCLAREVAYENDEIDPGETPEARWIRVRKWVTEHLVE